MPFARLLVAVLLLSLGAAPVAPAQDGATTAHATDVDTQRVALYQTGIAHVVGRVALPAPDAEGLARMTIRVPATTLLDTVALAHGARVVELRTPVSLSPAPQPGEEVVAHVRDGGSWGGTLLSADFGTLRIATGAGTVVIQRHDVVALELPARAGAASAEAATQAEVHVTGRVDPGATSATVSYLMRAPPWTASYHLDAATGAVSMRASLTAAATWRGVTLDLVAGDPRLMRDGGPTPLMLAVAEADARGFAPPVPLGALHSYRHEAPLDLDVGETAQLLVVNGTLDVVRHAREARAFVPTHGGGAAQPVPVLERVEVRNTLGMPLPHGIVDVFRHGSWVGQDHLPQLATHARANITVATDPDVRAELLPIATNLSGPERLERWALHIESLRDEPVDLRAVLESAPDARIVDVSPAPAEMRAGHVAWDARLPPRTVLSFEVTLAVRVEHPVEPAPWVEGAPHR